MNRSEDNGLTCAVRGFFYCRGQLPESQRDKEKMALNYTANGLSR